MTSGPIIRPYLIPSDDEKVVLSNILESTAPVLFHGIEVAGTHGFDNGTHIYTLNTSGGEIVYWYKGLRYRTTSAITVDIDSFYTITANTLYFIYFNDETGALTVSTSAWNLKTAVPVATVHWNGSAGSIINEKHGYTRNLDWHINAHLTIGTRYYSGLATTYPNAANDALIQIESGTIYDEDVVSNITQQTNCRLWYLVDASHYTWVNSTTPYPWSGSAVQYLDTDTYTLTAMAVNEYAPMWVYATPDTDRAIYIVPGHLAAPYGTVAAARASTPPSLTSIPNVSPEWKLIARYIYRGNGDFEEMTDYRTSASLPGGGTAATSASAVSFTPYGDLSSTTVQGALQELDDEKATAAHTHTANDRFVLVIDGGGSAITTGIKARVEAPFSGTLTAWTLLADQSGAIKIDVWKDTYANYPPTDADSITNAHEPEIVASGDKAQDTDLSDWSSVTVTEGDILIFNVDSCSTITWVSLVLKVERTI